MRLYQPCSPFLTKRTGQGTNRGCTRSAQFGAQARFRRCKAVFRVYATNCSFVFWFPSERKTSVVWTKQVARSSRTSSTAANHWKQTFTHKRITSLPIKRPRELWQETVTEKSLMLFSPRLSKLLAWIRYGKYSRASYILTDKMTAMMTMLKLTKKLSRGHLRKKFGTEWHWPARLATEPERYLLDQWKSWIGQVDPDEIYGAGPQVHASST